MVPKEVFFRCLAAPSLLATALRIATDAILDRLVHNAHRLRLADASIRKADANLTKGRKQAK
ncbi:ATP-binding protein [Myxococcus vastator]|uniref:ATP-binding protein n=1 Tax=Myxococcus vastator TaxID=2709664 RepID=UPI001F0886FA|nr:ATP-binding protein [Myxococcus vastator]